MRKVWHREVQSLAQDHTVVMWPSRNSNASRRQGVWVWERTKLTLGLFIPEIVSIISLQIKQSTPLSDLQFFAGPMPLSVQKVWNFFKCKYFSSPFNDPTHLHAHCCLCLSLRGDWALPQETTVQGIVGAFGSACVKPTVSDAWNCILCAHCLGRPSVVCLEQSGALVSHMYTHTHTLACTHRRAHTHNPCTHEHGLGRIAIEHAHTKYTHFETFAELVHTPGAQS